MKFLKLVSILLIAGCTIDKTRYTVGDCTVDVIDGGQVVTCGADQVVIPDQMPITEIADPCGDGPGVDEVVIMMEGNMALAWYKNVGIVLLEPYTAYTTTDAQRCRFRVTPAGVEEL